MYSSVTGRGRGWSLNWTEKGGVIPELEKGVVPDLDRKRRGSSLSWREGGVIPELYWRG
jgi:hypothetical protein